MDLTSVMAHYFAGQFGKSCQRQKASVDEIGAAATLLASYLGGEEPEEERDR